MQSGTSAFYPARDAEAGLREDQRSFLESATISLGLPSFSYASLRDPRVFETVVGRSLGTCECEKATIRGYRLGVANAEPGLPGLFPHAGSADSEVQGIVIQGLSRFEQTMMAWYEWNEYLLCPLPLTDGRPVQAFVPDPQAIRREYGEFDIAPWSFADWQSRRVGRAVAEAREWMRQRPDDDALARAGCFAPADIAAESIGG
ncbi:MAG: gamma-glutamylcyclotransferase family protein [Gammaproteobacteria bacterium]|nr:gamma-glutamylcyclotransferase family protein [Gammaproteobacteria bacterium]